MKMPLTGKCEGIGEEGRGGGGWRGGGIRQMMVKYKLQHCVRVHTGSDDDASYG